MREKEIILEETKNQLQDVLEKNEKHSADLEELHDLKNLILNDQIKTKEYEVKVEELAASVRTKEDIITQLKLEIKKKSEELQSLQDDGHEKLTARMNEVAKLKEEILIKVVKKNQKLKSINLSCYQLKIPKYAFGSLIIKYTRTI